MLVSRFLLDLQEAHQRKVVLLGSSSLLDSPSSLSSWVAFGSSHAHSGSQGASGTLVFATDGTLGALGASIDPEDWRDAEDPYDAMEAFRFTVADNPGLIEDASANVGLGHSFLRSIERSHALAYVVDLAGDAPWDELRVLREELERYE